MKKTVLCTSSHPVDLDDGRTLGPGEWAEDIEVDDDPHNAHLIELKHLLVLDSAPVHAPRDPGSASSSAVAAPSPAPQPATATAAIAEEPGGSA